MMAANEEAANDDFMDVFDMLGDEFFSLDLPGGGKTKIDDDVARKTLAAQRRAQQLEYEEALLIEVRKLQSLAKTEAVVRKQNELEERERKEREKRKRTEEEERRRKHLEKEHALVEAEKRQAAEWAKKQKEAEQRTAEIEKQKQAVIERERRERQRTLVIAREKQQQIAAKAIREKKRQAEIKRQLDEQKQASLLARLDEKRQARLEANHKKAEVAARRVEQAWLNRKQQLEVAEKEFHMKHEQQEQRLQKLAEDKEASFAARKQEAEKKREYIGRVLNQQAEREDEVKRSITEKDEKRSARQQAASEVREKGLREHRVITQVQQHEARERVLSALNARMAAVKELESKWGEKDERTNKLLEEREKLAEQRRALFALLARERQTVANTMERSKVTKKFELPLHIRKGVTDPALKMVLDKADPKETGVLTLTALNDVLSEIDPALLTKARAGSPSSTDRGSSPPPGELQRMQRVFSKMDHDADGTIDYSEFAQITKKLMRQTGHSAPSERWLKAAFESADTDGSGQIGFDEFVATQSQFNGSSPGDKKQRQKSSTR